MSKLVVLTEGLTTRSHELNVEKTTIGRVEDNTFQVPDASVSSHHCEIYLRSGEVVVKDLNSTNGTFINGTVIVGEVVLKPGQTLRLGQVEMRLENGESTPVAPVNAPAATPAKRPPDYTTTMVAGVNLNDLQGHSSGFETASKAFTKKTNKGNRIFVIVVIAVAVLIVGAIILISTMLKK